MKSKLLSSDIEALNLGSKIEVKLANNNIIKVSDLWMINRKQLKSFDLSDSEINSIIIKLQLNGLDLSKRVYDVG